MLAPATMRLCNNAVLVVFFAGAVLSLAAQQPTKPATPSGSAATTPTATTTQAAPAPSLTVDTDPVRSPDAEPPTTTAGPMKKEGEGYVLHTDVEEVVLNATVLEGNRLVPDLTKDDFQVFEDGVKQTLISFQHTDLPVSIALVVDNSGSM